VLARLWISSGRVNLLAHDSDSHYHGTVAGRSSQISMIRAGATVALATISAGSGVR